MATKAKLLATGSAAATIIGVTPPASPIEGQMWYDTTDGTLYIRTGSLWIEAIVTTAGATGAAANPLPIGTTAQRSGSLVAGSLRINSDTNYIETYYNSIWSNVTFVGPVLAAASTNAGITYVGNYAIHTFLTTGTFTPSSSGIVDYLIVAGGGSGGGAGGAGGGGLRTGTGYSVTGQVYSIVVGAGGAAVASSIAGNNGTNSSALSMTAIGGGGGGNYSSTLSMAGLAGGSGGGGGWQGGAGGAGTAGQGYAGGTSIDTTMNPWTSAGGGGAGGVGLADSGSVSGNGGPGALSSIDGTTYYYAGGGGGGSQNGGTSGSGGIGGGGGGAAATSGTVGAGGTSARNAGGTGTGGAGTAVGGSGGANTGAGGGGMGISVNTSGAGGSGIVIIKYRYQ